LAQSGSTGGINGDFGSPTGVAVGAGFIAVSDSAFENIQVFNSTGGYLYSIPSLGGSPNLWDVAIDAYGELYCADLGNGAVDGYYLGQTGATYDYTWSGQGVLSGPGGVRIDANGNLVVADFYNAVVYNLNWADDTVLNQTGTTYLSKPFGVALDPAGNIYVADGAKQIVEYGSGYNYVNSFTGSGWTTPLGESCGVGVDSQGNLFISDYTNARVVYATTQGKYLGELDGFGGPDHLVLDNADDLFVADYYYYAVDEYTK
jgi:serine/threonine-protein kinase